MSRYKITWDTKDLKTNGFGILDIKKYLEESGATKIQLNGSRIELDTTKSGEGLSQELRRVFIVKFYVERY